MWRAVRRGYAVVALGPYQGGDRYRCFNNSWPMEDYMEMPTVRSHLGSQDRAAVHRYKLTQEQCAPKPQELHTTWCSKSPTGGLQH